MQNLTNVDALGNKSFHVEFNISWCLSDLTIEVIQLLVPLGYCKIFEFTKCSIWVDKTTLAFVAHICTR